MRKLILSAIHRFLASRNRAVIPTMVALGRDRRINVLDREYTNEYVRLSHLELAAHEISSNGISGAIAEVGVYKGHFASFINAAIPDRTFYLFDTFEGFADHEESSDRVRHGLSYKRDFKDTSAELALARMPFVNNCIVKKGLFPATAAGLENDVFCFVSLDADLYDPILAGLRFFFPRLSPGGFIFVHDYNNASFPGARAAVLTFAAESGASFVPVSDAYGTAIFRRSLL